MNKKQTKRSQALKWIAATVLTAAVAACSSPELPPANNYTALPDIEGESKAHEADSPQQNYLDNASSVIEAVPVTNETEPDVSNFAESSSVTAVDKGKNPASSKTSDKDWAAASPKLLNLSIGDTEAAVVEKYGKALDNYTLSDGPESISVYEYNGFAVGLNTSKKVQFVELFGANIQAGLSGLQIGDKLDAALDALGKPDTQTDYLLTYQAEGAFLKLDLDPAVDEVISIKLLMS